MGTLVDFIVRTGGTLSFQDFFFQPDFFIIFEQFMNEVPDIPLIRITRLSKSYFKGEVEIQALRDVSFDVNPGEIFSIVGKSGSGKSTLLNLIGGLDHASSGEILFEDLNLSRMKRSELALYRRFSVGMIFQSFNLIPSRTALENVSLALTFGGVPRRMRKQQSIELLERVGLKERVSHKPSELSGGEAQRVAIARALANNPKVLLADEPTGNLDSVTSKEIIELLLTLNKEKGITILLVTHDQETANQVSKAIIRLKDGAIIN